MNAPYYAIVAALFFTFLYVTGRVLWPATGKYPLGLPLATALGMSFWICVSFALCATGYYTPTVLRSLFWSGLVLALVWLVIRSRVARATAPAISRNPMRLNLLVVVLMSVPMLVVAISPGAYGDSLVYHLTVPKLYLRAEGFRELPYLVYSNWPLAFELLFGWALALQDHVLAKLTHWWCGVLLALSLWRYCRSRGHATAGVLAAALFLLSETVRYEMFVAYVDVGHALLFFLAFILWEEAIDTEDASKRRWRLILTAVLLGVVAGCKLTGLVGTTILVVCHLVFGLRRPGHRGSLIPELAILVGIPLLLWWPWAFRSWLYTGNAVYPLLYEWFGGHYFSGDLAHALRESHASIGWVDIREYPVLAIGIPLAVLGAILDRRCRRLLLVAALYGAYWAMSSPQIRLLIPALPFVAASAALATSILWRRWLPTPRWGPGTLAAAACIGLLVPPLPNLRNFFADWSFRPSLSSGLKAKLQIPDYIQHINEHLPPDARLMFLRTNHGYFCEREFICDSFFEASQMAALIRQAGKTEALHRRLRQERITHILMGRMAYVPLPDYFTKALEQQQGFKLEFRGKDADVYRVVYD